MSQRSFAKLLNWGDKTIRRYENGSIQDKAHNSLLLFLREPQNMTSYLVENGFRSLDFDKLCAMVIFFAQKFNGLLKVKLLKLLNYSDMLFYKENGISISGAVYVHLPYGSVMQNYDILFGMMEADKIMHIEVEFDNGYEKHQVIPDCNMPDGVLTDSEIEVLERIYKKFADFGSVEISNFSHKEKGYRETKKGEVISYAYTKDIEIF